MRHRERRIHRATGTGPRWRRARRTTLRTAVHRSCTSDSLKSSCCLACLGCLSLRPSTEGMPGAICAARGCRQRRRPARGATAHLGAQPPAASAGCKGPRRRRGAEGTHAASGPARAAAARAPAERTSSGSFSGTSTRLPCVECASGRTAGTNVIRRYGAPVEVLRDGSRSVDIGALPPFARGGGSGRPQRRPDPGAAAYVCSTV
jgi:hypothetical protein